MWPQSRFSFGNLTEPQKIFYNTHGNQAIGYQMLKDYLNTGGNSRYNSYLDSLMGDEYNRMLSRQAATDGAYQWVPHLEEIQGKLAQGWQGLTTAARGGNLGLYGANQRYLG